MSAPAVDPDLLPILVCPDCHGGLRLDDDGATADVTLTCTACGLVYPVRDGIPVLLVDEATRPR